MSDRTAFLAKHAARITRDPVYGCWIWTGPIDRDGYGTSWGKDGPRRAHLVAYRELVGPVPAGKVLDHLCRRRACCRPEHLEPIKGAENDLRRSWRVRCRRTTCPNGHSLSTCITSPEGGRICRTCQGPETDDRPFAGIDRGVAPSLLGGKVADPPPPGALIALIEREARALAAKNADAEDRDPGDEDVRP